MARIIERNSTYSSKDNSRISLTFRTLKAVLWSGTSQLTGLGLQIIIGAVLARLLFPEDFGMLGMVAVFSGFVGMFQELGLGAAIVQRKDITEEHLSSVFLTNIVAGLFLSIVMLGLAPGIAYFYGEKRLTLITLVLGTRFFISSFGIIQRTLLTKQLDFKKLAIIDIFSEALAGVSAIILAFMGVGVWSLVIQSLVSSMASVIILWFWSEWQPHLAFCWKSLKELAGYGFNLMGFRFVNYFNRNLDNLLIGKFLGAASLGYYGKAYSIMLLPIQNISWTISRALFPAFSIIQDDLPRVREKYLQTNKYVSMITFPMMMGLLVLAPETIRILFGHKWESSIILLQILCPVGMLQSISTSVGTIYMSQGRTDIQLKWSIVTSIITVLSFIIALRWGVKGIAIAYCIVSYALALPCFYIAFHIIKLPMGMFLRNFALTIASSLIMALIVFGYRSYLKNSLQAGDVVTLISCFIIGVASYIILLWIFGRKIIREFFGIIRQMRNPAKAIVES